MDFHQTSTTDGETDDLAAVNCIVSAQDRRNGSPTMSIGGRKNELVITCMQTYGDQGVEV